MKKSILYGNDFRCSAKSFIAAISPFAPNGEIAIEIGTQSVHPDINDWESVDRIFLVDSKLGAPNPCFIKHPLLITESRE